MPFLIILNLILYTVNFRTIYWGRKHILIWPILIYRVNSCPYKFLASGRRTYFYITGMFIYFSPSKNRMIIVHNEIYFYTSKNTNKIVLALRKHLLNVWQVSLGRLLVKNRSRRNTTPYICTRSFKINFCP